MLKLIGAKVFAAYVHQKNKKWINNPFEAQQKVFKLLLQEGIKTRFGKEHHFEKIQTPNEFSLGVPVRDYEDLKPYIDSVFGRGKPMFFGQEDRCIMQSRAEQPQVQNIFLFLKNLCHNIFVRLVKHF